MKLASPPILAGPPIRLVGLLVGSFVALTVPSTEVAAEPLTAAQIVQRSLDHMVFRSRGAEMTMTMTLRNKRKETRKRTLFARSRTEGDLTRSLVRFLTPSDVAGTAFLFVENRGRDDDQYMYLPALKVTKRIVGKQKQARFMGSDFTYADLEWRDLDEARHSRRPDEKVGKQPCHVIDSIPNGREAYSRIRSWIRTKDLVPLRVQFFDTRNKLLKVLFVKEVKRIDGSLVVTQFKMANKQSGHATFLQISNIRLRDDLPAEDFSVRALTQG